jgi:hypothetical protein
MSVSILWGASAFWYLVVVFRLTDRVGKAESECLWTLRRATELGNPKGRAASEPAPYLGNMRNFSVRAWPLRARPKGGVRRGDWLSWPRRHRLVARPVDCCDTRHAPPRAHQGVNGPAVSSPLQLREIRRNRSCN